MILVGSGSWHKSRHQAWWLRNSKLSQTKTRVLRESNLHKTTQKGNAHDTMTSQFCANTGLLAPLTFPSTNGIPNLRRSSDTVRKQAMAKIHQLALDLWVFREIGTLPLASCKKVRFGVGPTSAPILLFCVPKNQHLLSSEILEPPKTPVPETS